MMKSFFKLASMFAVVIIMAGCGGGSGVEPKMYGELKGAPQWVVNGGIEGAMSAVGSSKIGKAGIGHARTRAMTLARNDLASQMSIKVKSLLEDFVEVTGMGDDETVDSVSTQITRQVASETLKGSKLKESWISKSNTMHVLVIVDIEMVKNTIKSQTETSMKNEKALWQKFQAEKGYKKLEEQVDKEFKEFNK